MTSNQLQQEERLLSAEEVADLIGVSSRTVLAMPVQRIRIGPRTIRFRLCDIYQYLGVHTPVAGEAR